MSLHELTRNLVYKKIKNTTCLKITKSSQSDDNMKTTSPTKKKTIRFIYTI